MVAINPSAPPVCPPTPDPRPLRAFVASVVRYERSPHLASALQLSDELADAAGMSAPLDEDPPEPSPALRRRLAGAMHAAARSIRAAKTSGRPSGEGDRAEGSPRETKTFRVDPASAYRAKQLLAQGMSDADVKRITGLGRKALLTIKRGDVPRTLGRESAELERCPDCGGLCIADAPCLLCVVRGRG